MEIINYLIKCKNVERLSGKFKHRGYNLLEHQYLVGMLFRHFASIEDVPYDIRVWDIILKHDIVETVTQDLVFPVKNFNKKTKKFWEEIEKEILSEHPKLFMYSNDYMKKALTEGQYNLFKVCDLLDLWIFCKQEIQFGNNSKDMNDVVKKCEELILGKFKSVNKFMANFIADDYV